MAGTTQVKNARWSAELLGWWNTKIPPEERKNDSSVVERVPTLGSFQLETSGLLLVRR